jgi:hypothetical protein
MHRIVQLSGAFGSPFAPHTSLCRAQGQTLTQQGLAGPKLHILAFERTKPVHFMGLTAADTWRRFQLAS